MSESKEASYGDSRGSSKTKSAKKAESGFTFFLPFMFLAISLLIILTYQLALTSARKDALTQQLVLMQKQEQQASLFKASLQSIVNDLRQLGQTDPEAQAVVRKFITVQQPQPGATPPAPNP